MNNRAISVLYVNSQAEIGGVERFLDSVLTNHDLKAVRPLLLACQDGPWLKDLSQRGIKVYCIDKARLRQPSRCFSEVRKILTTEKIDIVHSSYAWCHALVSPAALWQGCKRIWFHHGPVWSKRWQGFMPLYPADLVLTNSHFLLSKLRKTIYWSRRLGVVHYGLDAGNWAPQVELRTAFRKAWNIGEETIAIGAVGFVDEGKGQDVLLRAASELRKHGLPVHVFIIGGPRSGSAFSRCQQFRDKLNEFVRASNLENIVSFTGHLNINDGAMDGLDIFVHASTQADAFGMTILEAMAKRKPVIASAEGGPAEIIADGIDGLLIEPGRADKLASAIRFLCDHPENRNRLGAMGLNKVTTVFSPQRATEKLEHWYKSLTGHNSVSSTN